MSTIRYLQQRLASGERVASVTLAAPARCNSLEPHILTELTRALDQACEAGATFVILQAEGRHFSTGGDVTAFQAAVQAGNEDTFSDDVVGLLQDVIRRLLALPAIVVTAAQGAITGGSAGLVFASDLVLLSEDAFIQPYFAEVGFSPDGGWTALLPEKIGAGRALQIQLANERLPAKQALHLGLAHRVIPNEGLADAAMSLVERLSRQHVASGMLASKRLVWDADRISAVDARLSAELASFKRQIAAPETQAGMRRFLDQLAGANDNRNRIDV